MCIRDSSNIDIGIVGVPWDGGTTNRPGARHGPREVRNASSLVRLYHPISMKSPYDKFNVADLGDCPVNPADLQDSLKKIENYFINSGQNKKFKALVTAGPTREYIDPVRYITNKSSGKQGFELAKSLSKKGFETTLISGPTKLKASKDINFIKVETAEQMFIETQNSLPADVAIFSAAVSDFRIKNKKEQKVKKEDYTNLNLENNIDILHYVSNHNSLRPKLVIGFAAETSNLDENSKNKLVEKNCDWIVANDVSNKSIGFDSDFNEVTIFYKDKKINDEKLNMKKKSEISDEIIDKVISQLN